MTVAAPPHSGNGAARYFLPSVDEWYKAAYYKSGGTNAGYWTYPTQSNTAPDNSLALATSESNDTNYYINNYADPTNLLTPVGTFAASPGPYGTFDQGEDSFQWNEANLFSNTYRVARGGSFNNLSNILSSPIRGTGYPAAQYDRYGFRVASSVAVPEPDSVSLLLAGGLCLLGVTWQIKMRSPSRLIGALNGLSTMSLRLDLRSRNILKQCSNVLVILLAGVSTMSAHAFGSEIVLTQTGTGSGRIGTTAFTNANFTITATANTNDRLTAGIGIYYEDHDEASIAIDGLGDYQFLSGTRTFVNQGSGQVGFSRAGASGYDLFSNLNNSAFHNWAMITSVGPVTGFANLKQWGSGYPPVETTGGQLIFNDQSTISTFQATVSPLPEPSTLALLGVGAFGLVICGLRRRRRPV